MLKTLSPGCGVRAVDIDRQHLVPPGAIIGVFMDYFVNCHRRPLGMLTARGSRADKALEGIQ